MRGLSNVQVITADVNALTLPSGDFDRVVSVEMFEHMRNYRDLLARVGSWLAPGGKLFVHIFATVIWPTRSKWPAKTTGWAGISLPAG